MDAPNLYLALRLASIPWRRDNLSSRPVFRDGQPVESREAVARRNELIERLASLPPVPGALDQIVQRFGTDLVAEVTGRSRRVVRKGGRPLSPLDRVFRRETMSSVSSMIRRAASRNSWPAGVSRAPPFVRSNRVAPTSCSRSRIRRLSVDCRIFNFSAACRKLRNCDTAIAHFMF